VRLSARNQLRGRVTALELGTVMAEVTIDVGGGNEIVATITRTSAEALDLKRGTEVVAIIKSTEVIVGMP
jgi:molybdopterin-binding protein